MIYPSIDKISEKVGSKFTLVNIVSKRAKQIEENEHLQMPTENYRAKKYVGRALEEIAEGLIKINE